MIKWHISSINDVKRVIFNNKVNWPMTDSVSFRTWNDTTNSHNGANVGDVNNYTYDW